MSISQDLQFQLALFLAYDSKIRQQKFFGKVLEPVDAKKRFVLKKQKS